MSIIDTTHVDVAVKTAPGAAAPVTTPADKPSGDGGNGAAKTADAARPDASNLINDILDKHGLSSPEELAEFIDRVAETAGQIGDNDPDELLKAKTTLDAYQRKWNEAEQAKLKEAETPEQTIARLEREAADRDNKAAQRDRQKRNADAAKAAVKTFNDVITSTVKAEKDIPAEYVPFLHKLLGVGSPVNSVNITDRAAVKKMAKEFGIAEMRAFEQAVIKRYRDGKAEIPVVPSTASETAPVADEHKPKNLNEARTMAHASFKALFSKK
jgi:Skp family chaperone for outer membrane proteins